MRRTVRKAGLLITSATAGLAALSQCNAGLLGDFFDKHTDKDRNEVEKRLPACDCSFGYFSTAWQPWGTCDQNSRAGCSSGSCSNSSPSILPGFRPGYSSGQPSSGVPTIRESWTPPGATLSPTDPGSIHSFPGPGDSSPAPILMTPVQPEPATDSSTFAPGGQQPSAMPQPPAANPFPRAVRTNPELPSFNANPYSNPNSPPSANPPSPYTPLPQLTPGASVPLDPPQSSPAIPAPAATLPQPFTQPAPNYGSQGTGITLPPRRATSVTIDVPPGSAGSTLSLPDPARSGSNFGGAAGSPFPEAGTPQATPSPAGAPLRPLTPEPSLRRQPPTPMPSVIPGPAATYRMPYRQTVPQQMVPGQMVPGQIVPGQAVPQFPPVQYANAQPMIGQYPAVPPQQQQIQQIQPTQQFQPATHWQAVPQQQPQPQRNWRVIPGAYIQQPGMQQMPQAQPQRLQPTPSERVIYLPPPPRR